MNKTMNPTIEILPHKKKVVSAKRLVYLSKKKHVSIKKVKFVRPKLGTMDLGKFIVVYE